MREKRDKRGELSSAQIISIVILIISFVVILIFFFILSPKNEITAESCRNSVLLKANSFGSSVKLQCTTQTVCISGGGDCLTTAKDIQKINVMTKEDLYSALSDLMYNCWWEMGEGKVDYAPTGLGFMEKYCNICNNIVFDDKLRANNDLNSINMKDFYTYLANKQAPNGDSMIYYLYKVNSMDGVRDAILANTNGAADIYKENIDLTQGQKFALVTSIQKQGYGPTLIGTGVGVAAGIALGVVTMNPGAGIAGATWIAKGAQVATTIGLPISVKGLGIAGWATGYFLTSGNENYQPPTLYSYDADSFKQLQCKEFTSQAS